MRTACPWHQPSFILCEYQTPPFFSRRCILTLWMGTRRGLRAPLRRCEAFLNRGVAEEYHHNGSVWVNVRGQSASQSPRNSLKGGLVSQ